MEPSEPNNSGCNEEFLNEVNGSSVQFSYLRSLHDLFRFYSNKNFYMQNSSPE